MADIGDISLGHLEPVGPDGGNPGQMPERRNRRQGSRAKRAPATPDRSEEGAGNDPNPAGKPDDHQIDSLA